MSNRTKKTERVAAKADYPLTSHNRTTRKPTRKLSKYPLHTEHADPLDFELSPSDLRVPKRKIPVHKLHHDFKADLSEVRKRLVELDLSKPENVQYLVGYIDHALTED